MKKEIIYTVITCISIVYLIFSFVQWEFNPSIWGASERCGACLISFISVLVYSLFKHE